jgi:hypothetical protein
MKHFKRLGLTGAAMILAAAAWAGTASATELLIGDTPLGLGTITASVKSGTSSLIVDKNATTKDTCTGSTIKMTIEKDTGTGGWDPSGKVSTLSFSGCTHTTHVIANGSFSVVWSSGTKGTVSMSGTEVTIKSTVFGASAVCKTGAGITIGTLTGVSSGSATLHVNATTLNCGLLGTSSWTGTFTITLPTTLAVEES